VDLAATSSHKDSWHTKNVGKKTMVRPRNILLSYFPDSAAITVEQASEALRDSNGDIDKAREAIKNTIRNDCSSNLVVASNRDSAYDVTSTSIAEDMSKKKQDQEPRRPPNTSASVNNLSDRQYCCVWSVEVYEDGYRPEVARTLLASIARHVNPILRARGWRVKRLMESASTQFIGCCTGNGRYDADAASTNIQLNLRTQPSKYCTTFRSFSQLLSVMLHEITHTSIGLEDIHPYVVSIVSMH
jgi:hypothetical protein